MFIQKTKIGPWEVNTSQESIHMTNCEVESLHYFIPTWRKCFPRSGNLAEKHFDTPSAIIRFDYVVTSQGMVHVYEIEERPAGLGVTSSIHPRFLEAVLPLIKEQEEAIGLPWSLYVSEAREGSSDDEVFSQNSGVRLFRGNVPSEVVNSRAWYVRANRNEEYVAKHFTSNSLSTIVHEGNKSYGTSLGLWEEMAETYEPDFTVPFAVKPGSGSRFEEVLIFHPNKKLGAGFATRTKVLDAIRRGKVKFIQAYGHPETIPFLDEKYRLIRRAYFAWSPKKSDYVSLGGLWVAAPSVRVHGTRDAISGVLFTA